ncbi:MAG: T9SS type A sorting domain-containing protein [Chitinophagales bacterium]|nr:T9SS type A sorting domain-containing protein [Chitinophagales bacterium]
MKISFTFTIIAVFSCVISNAQTWFTIEANTDQHLEAIDFVDDNPAVGYIGGDNILLKTTNYGKDWNPVEIVSLPSENSVLNVHDLHFFDENHGYMTSDYLIWETTDGGLNWTISDIPFNCFAVSLHFASDDIGFIGGRGCFEGHVIVRVEDGIGSQSTTPNDWIGASNNEVTSIAFKDQTFGLAGTATGDMLRTIDGGFNWDTIPNIAGDSAITGFIFEEDRILATHANNSAFGTMMSTDNGLTWEMDGATATFFYPQMFAAHRSQAGAAYLGGMDGFGMEGGVIFSNEGGFWNYESVQYPVKDIASHSDSITFCVGKQGTIYVNVDPSVIVNVEEHEISNFNLSPNPATTFLNIEGELAVNSSYAIYDISGKKIKEGNFDHVDNQRIDVADLVSGVYTITLRSDQQFKSLLFTKE